MGYKGQIALYLYYIGVANMLRAIAPPMAAMTAQESALVGAFRCADTCLTALLIAAVRKGFAMVSMPQALLHRLDQCCVAAGISPASGPDFAMMPKPHFACAGLRTSVWLLMLRRLRSTTLLLVLLSSSSSTSTCSDSSHSQDCQASSVSCSR